MKFRMVFKRSRPRHLAVALFLMITFMIHQAGFAWSRSFHDKGNSRSESFTRITEGPLVNDILNSPGVCIIDYDGDNLLDIYMINMNYTGEPSANTLYRNIGGASFEQITGLAIVEDLANGYAASWADFDNDGDLDVAVANFEDFASMVYINDGNGNFNAMTDGPAGVVKVRSTSASWIDYNLDNNLDLFITNGYGEQSSGMDPYPNFLFRNDNHILNLVTSGIIASHSRHTYVASWGDFNDDGNPDLVNVNSYDEPSDFFLNNGDGNFTLLPTSFLGPDTTSGGSSWIDYDNDGDLDLFIAGTKAGPSLLYRNDGNGVLSKVMDHGIGIEEAKAIDGRWADYDNDGDLDIFVAYRHFEDGSPPEFYAYLYENLGDGNFNRLSNDMFDCSIWSISSYMWGDIDRDGDMDLFIARYDPEALDRPGYASDILYLNYGNDNHWITVKPVGSISNRSAVGAKVRIKATINGQPVWQLRELTTMTGLRGQPPLEAHFGLSDAFIIDSIKIEWPGGQITDVLTDVAVNQYLTVTESICGDVNGDGRVDILDIVFLINYKYKSGLTPDPFYAADVNSSGQIDILDIVYLINYKYKSGPKPNCP